MSRIFIYIFFGITLLSSCDFLKSKEDGKVVAKVFDKYLYEKDLIQLFSSDISAEDSATVADAYIDKWIKDNLLLQKAELNMDINKTEFEQQINNYRNSLIIYNYEKSLIEQNFDTNISITDIKEYYNNNSANFVLKNNILKVFFAKVPIEAPKTEELQKYFLLRNDKEFKNAEEYCVQFAQKYSMDTSSWMTFNQLRREIPIAIDDEESFLKNNKSKQWADSSFVYYLSIFDYKVKTRIAPLEFAEEDIKATLLNQKKMKMIANMKQGIYEDALRKKQFEIYTE